MLRGGHMCNIRLVALCGGLLLQLLPTVGALYSGNMMATTLPELFVAIEQGNGKEVLRLLEAGHSPNQRVSTCSTKDGAVIELTENTPLHAAAEAGQCDSISFLLQAGARPNVTRSVHIRKKSAGEQKQKQDADVLRETPLHVAVKCGFVSCVKALLDGGADLRKTDQNQRNAIEVHKRMASRSSSRAASELMKRYLNWEYFVRVQVEHCVQMNRTSLPLAHCNMKSTYPAIRWSNVASMADHITHLDLSHNLLTTVAPEMGVLHNLVVLNLSHNQIKELPMTLAVLNQLVDLNVRENPLNAPPRDIVKKGTKAILSFLEGKRAEDVKATELKVVIVGEKESGKTALANALSSEDVAKEEPKSIRMKVVRSIQRTASNAAIGRQSFSADSLSGVKFNDPLMLSFSLRSALATEMLQQPIPSYIKSSEKNLRSLCKRMLSDLDVRELSFELQRFPQCVLGVEVTDWLVEHKAKTRADAVALGNKMMEYGFIEHPTTNRLFEDKRLPYRFNDLEHSKKKKKTKGASKITFNLWDFNGRVEEESKKLAFSDRALYLVAWNLERLSTDARIEHWLQMISSTTKQASVILVGTHADAEVFQTGKIDLVTTLNTIDDKWSTRFPFILHITGVSTADGMGVQELQSQLVSHGVQKLARSVPYSSKVDALGAIFELERQRKRTPPVIVWEDLRMMGRTLQMTARDLKTALAQLHECGSIIWFSSSDLSIGQSDDIVLLQLPWVLNAYSAIVASKRFLLRSSVLRHEFLTHIWSGVEYPEWVFDVLLKLLHRQELLFRIPRACIRDEIEFEKKTLKANLALSFDLEQEGDPGTSIVPALLPAEEPADLMETFTANTNAASPAEVMYYRMIVLSFLPEGLFPRFLTHMLAQSDRCALLWDRGVCFELGMARILVRVLDRYKRKAITIVATRRPQGASSPSPDPLDFNGLEDSATDTFEGSFCHVVEVVLGLCREWFAIKVNQFVPCYKCCTAHADRSTKQGDTLIFRGHPISLFSFHSIEKGNAVGKTFVRCDEGCKDVSIKMLAPDVTRVREISKKAEDVSKYEREKTIGHGSFARVSLVHVHGNKDEQYAMKEMTQVTDDSFYETFRHEVEMLHRISHPNIVRLEAFGFAPPSIVLEYCPLGDLYSFMHSDTHRGFSWRVRCAIVEDVVLALEALHTSVPPILHRDLKSPNILLRTRSPFNRPIVKLSDFGESALMYTPEIVRRVVSTPTWLAPEVLFGYPYSLASDVYAIGVLMWEVLTYAHPFLEYQYAFTHQLEDMIKRGCRPSLPEPPVSAEDVNALSSGLLQVLIDEYYVLMQTCWHAEPFMRPTAKELARRLKMCNRLFELYEADSSGQEELERLLEEFSVMHSGDNVAAGVKFPERIRLCSVDGRDLLASRCTEVVQLQLRVSDAISDTADKLVRLQEVEKEIELLKKNIALQQEHSSRVRSLLTSVRDMCQGKLPPPTIEPLPGKYEDFIESELLRLDMIKPEEIDEWRAEVFPADEVGEVAEVSEWEIMQLISLAMPNPSVAVQAILRGEEDPGGKQEEAEAEERPNLEDTDSLETDDFAALLKEVESALTDESLSTDKTHTEEALSLDFSGVEVGDVDVDLMLSERESQKDKGDKAQSFDELLCDVEDLLGGDL